MYEFDDPPARNVQHSGAASHAAAPLEPLMYEWHKLVDEQFNGERRSESVQLKYRIVFPLVTLKGKLLFSRIPP